MDVEPAAGRDVVERADARSDRVRDDANDAECDEESNRGQEQPLARLVLEMEAIELGENLDHGLTRERSLLARAPGDLVLDDREIIAGKSVDMALERKRPVFGWPLAHIVEAIRQLFRRDPDDVVEDDVGPDVRPPC